MYGISVFVAGVEAGQIRWQAAYKEDMEMLAGIELKLMFCLRRDNYVEALWTP